MDKQWCSLVSYLSYHMDRIGVKAGADMKEPTKIIYLNERATRVHLPTQEQIYQKRKQKREEKLKSIGVPPKRK